MLDADVIAQDYEIEGDTLLSGFELTRDGRQMWSKIFIYYYYYPTRNVVSLTAYAAISSL
jgi:hypothetical protein